MMGGLEKLNCVVSALFKKRTSEVQLALLERVEVGEGVVDEVCREPHFYFLFDVRRMCGFVSVVADFVGRFRGWVVVEV